MGTTQVKVSCYAIFQFHLIWAHHAYVVENSEPLISSFSPPHIRAAGGVITEFDVPGAANGENNSGINPVGRVTSYYLDANFAFHGYVRAPDGTFTLFDLSGGGAGPFQGTEPLNINASGAITGSVVDSAGVNHGFLRAVNGSTTKFDAPGAGAGSGQGTIPVYNNPSNAISGFVIDGNGVAHGFLRLP